MKYYTGIGSRETPPDVIQLMRKIAKKLAQLDYTLRSGGAPGADSAFEEGWWDNRLDKDASYTARDYECYIPWDNFEGHTRSNYDGCNFILGDMPIELRVKAEAIASEIHPAWDRLSQGAKKLHTRNVFQVLGQDLETPSKFVVAYATLDGRGEPKGGTRTAIKIAEKFDVRVFNLFDQDHIDRLELFVKH